MEAALIMTLMTGTSYPYARFIYTILKRENGVTVYLSTEYFNSEEVVKLDGKNSKQKNKAANPNHNLLAVYRKTNFIGENSSDSLKGYIYSGSAIAYFREKRKFHMDDDFQKKIKEIF